MTNVAQRIVPDRPITTAFARQRVVAKVIQDAATTWACAVAVVHGRSQTALHSDLEQRRRHFASTSVGGAVSQAPAPGHWFKDRCAKKEASCRWAALRWLNEAASTMAANYFWETSAPPLSQEAASSTRALKFDSASALRKPWQASSAS